ncbi:glycosyl transferase [Acetobacter aceti 1023]|nr:glycosyl transferase [Acetobacter aceti 1023]
MQLLLNSPDPVSKNGLCDFSDTGLPAGSVCFFAAYAPNGILPPFTQFYLKNILNCGFILHLVLSGDTPADKETIFFCKKNNIHFWQRPNGGMDFGAWRFLFQKNVAAHAPYVLLANDSVFGPFRPLATVLAHAHAYTLPAWGLIASRLVTPHLQSWFIGLSHKTLQTAPVQQVFSLPFEHMSRNEIIWHGELGLSVALQEAGIPLQAAWSDLNAPLARFLPTNPMHTHWYSLAASGQVPFIKRELLRNNSFAIPNLHQWPDVIPPTSGFNPQWIADSLTQHDPRPAPATTTAKGRMLYRLINTADTLLWKTKRHTKHSAH